MNGLLARYAVRQGTADPAVIRTDTTVVETNIHYPSDSSLFWDTWRVASRILRRARQTAPESVPYRFHDRKIKKLYLYVTRYLPSKSPRRQRTVKTAFRTLIERTGRMLVIAEEFCAAGRRAERPCPGGPGTGTEDAPARHEPRRAERPRAQVKGEPFPPVNGFSASSSPTRS